MRIVELGEKQKASVAAAERRINLWEGSVRSGKTLSSLLAWLDFLARGPEGPHAAIGRTEGTLKRNVIDPLTELLPSNEIRVTNPSGSREMWIWNRKVYLVGASSELAEEKIRGMTLVGVLGDQAETWPESAYKMTTSRLTIDGAKAFLTANPDAPRHWLKTDVIDREGEIDLARFTFRLRDNPGLSDATVAALEAEYVGLWRKRFIDGLWVAAEGVVYDMFDEDVHVVSQIPPCESWWLGVDYGTSNPLVGILLGHGADGNLYAAQEFRWAPDPAKGRPQRTDAQHSKKLIEWLGERGATPDSRDLVREPMWDATWREWRHDRVAVDRSARSFILQLWNDGLPRTGGSAKGLVLDQVRVVASLFAQNRLFIHESCVGLREELGSYSWDPKAQAIGEDKPLKVDDHGPDALRYAVMAAKRVWRRWVSEVPDESAEDEEETA